MKKIVIPTVLSLALCSLSFPLQAYAADVNMEENAMVSETDISRAAGLIFDYNLSISSGSKIVYMTTFTQGYYQMSEIGCKNIRVQRSSDKATWSTEVNLESSIINNNSIYSDSNDINVEGGYYYRVILTHYAKEPLGNTQLISNTSNSVWVPK